MTYNLTNISSPLDMVTTANTLTGGKFGIVTGILIFVISLIYFATSERPFGYAFASAAYVTSILTIFLRVLGLVSDWFLYLMILLGIAGVAYTVFSKD